MWSRSSRDDGSCRCGVMLRGTISASSAMQPLGPAISGLTSTSAIRPPRSASITEKREIACATLGRCAGRRAAHAVEQRAQLQAVQLALGLQLVDRRQREAAVVQHLDQRAAGAEPSRAARTADRARPPKRELDALPRHRHDAARAAPGAAPDRHRRRAAPPRRAGSASRRRHRICAGCPASPSSAPPDSRCAAPQRDRLLDRCRRCDAAAPARRNRRTAPGSRSSSSGVALRAGAASHFAAHARRRGRSSSSRAADARSRWRIASCITLSVGLDAGQHRNAVLGHAHARRSSTAVAAEVGGEQQRLVGARGGAVARAPHSRRMQIIAVARLRRRGCRRRCPDRRPAPSCSRRRCPPNPCRCPRHRAD